MIPSVQDRLKPKQVLAVRVMTILKEGYLSMFVNRWPYYAELVRVIPIDWPGRVKVIMDIDERHLSEIRTYSSINSYKRVYRKPAIGNFIN